MKPSDVYKHCTKEGLLRYLKKHNYRAVAFRVANEGEEWVNDYFGDDTPLSPSIIILDDPSLGQKLIVERVGI